jgi:hypothetical protein
MTFVATIVAHAHVTKPEALSAIARAAGSVVTDAATSHPFVTLASGGRAEVEIPKFGEAPPLAIDVSDSRSIEAAIAEARILLESLVEATGWRIETQF